MGPFCSHFRLTNTVHISLAVYISVRIRYGIDISMSYVANSLYLFLSSKKPPGSLVLQLADRNSHFTRRFFHYVIFLTLPSIAGGCRCAEVTTTQKRSTCKAGASFLAAGEGFEPSQTESESVVLPLHNPAKFCFLRPATHERRTYYSKEAEIVKGFSEFF